MKKVIIGTAGHVDHGKTRLIEAITGIDCDRWEEEKQRGITLDLGFAHLTDDEVQLSFVDVPGHERFLHNALAGLGGIGAVLLVIDAGEGVRPQTQEHLEIVRLLGVERVIVALTKADAVESDWLDLAAAEVAEFMRRQSFAEAPIHRVSAQTGQGLEALVADLRASADGTAPSPEAPTRLPVDRAFQITGRGTVITGSPARGSVAEGDQLAINGGERTARVRRVEVHGEARDRANAGERVALQLADVSPEDVPRGSQLTADGAYLPSRSFAARITLLPDAPALEATRDLRLHLFAADLATRIRPLEQPIASGKSGWVEGILARRAVLAVGDRAILRRPSPPATIGGLIIVDPAWRRPRGPRLDAALKLLQQGDEELLRWWARAARLKGISIADVARRHGEAAEAARKRLEDLEGEGHLLRLSGGDRWLDPRVVKTLAEQASRDLAEHHRENPLEPGMSQGEFVRRYLSVVDDPQPYLDLLTSMRILAAAEGFVSRPGAGPALDDEQKGLAARLDQTLEELGFAVPSPRELAQKLRADPKVVEGLLHHLRRQSKTVKLPGDLWVSAVTLERTVEDLRGTGWEDFSVGDFKDRYGLSRKWAIPLLEYLDARKVTARSGDRRIVLR